MCTEREHDDNQALDHANPPKKSHAYPVPLTHSASRTVWFRISNLSRPAYAVMRGSFAFT
jgi:hypothetical protein